VAFGTDELDREKKHLQEEMNVVAELIQQCIAENARIAQNQGEYEKRYNALAERFDRAKARLSEVEDGIVAKQAQREMMQNLVDTLEGMPDAVDSFDEGAWYALVDYATVYGRDDIRFTFKNGMEIKA
jgi:site-specific DNA recombinase